MSKSIKTTIETGLRLSPVSVSSNAQLGDLEVSSILNKISFFNGSSNSPIVTEAHIATLTNKTLVVLNNTVTTAASGNLTATELNAALAELQADIDTRATEADLLTLDGIVTSHITADSGVHGVLGDVVGTTDTQNLSNKTITDKLTLANITTPVGNPSAGFSFVYPKSNSKLYIKNSAGVESIISDGALVRQTGNTRATPLLVDTADTITLENNQRNVIYVQGDGGAVILTSLVQIADPSLEEQEVIIVGTSNTDTLTFVNGNNLILNGDCSLGDYDSLYLRHDGTNWVEVSRNF